MPHNAPLIGITPGKILNHHYPWAPWIMGQSHTYIDAVLAAGGIPVILPMTTDKTAIAKLIAHCDGFLLSGGNDINPQYFDEPKDGAVEVDTLRDEFELALVRQIDETAKPLLAICRGLQVLNVARGGSLYQDIPTQLPGKQNHQNTLLTEDYESIAHHLKIDASSQLHELLGTTSITANSNHHQSIKTLGTDLVVTAWAEDDIIEAVEDPKKPFVFAVQCHPEALFENTEVKWQRLFKAFIQAATKE